MARGPEPTAAADGSAIEVRRSSRRRRTVSAYRDGDRIVVLVPSSLTATEEREWIETMVAKVHRSERRRRRSDVDLVARSAELSERFLGGLARPSSVRWVSNQESRWGSCTPADGSIRISDRLRPMPAWVVDYVLVHELAHLLEAHHNAEFWAWVAHYPQAERARGYLEGWSAASAVGGGADPAGDGVD